MANPDDTARKAAEFLQQWQEQLARSMTDPAVINSMLSTLSAFTPRGTSHDASPRRPAPAPDANDDAIGRLSKRLDAVERELAKLRQPVPAKAKNPARAKRRLVAAAKPKPKRPVAKRAKAKRTPKRK